MKKLYDKDPVWFSVLWIGIGYGLRLLRTTNLTTEENKL